LVLAAQEMEIQDMTETNLVNLRRIIYLTIMNALNYEEAVHKLLKVQVKEGQEVCRCPLGLALRFSDVHHRSNWPT
jgi:pre-mRNA-splicing factor CWC22